MNQQQIERRIVSIIERAEYGARHRGGAIKTRSNREATKFHEIADLSEREARQMAADLAKDLAS
jgi:hypothetical protein